MLNFGTFFLWALAVFTLLHGSLAEDPNQYDRLESQQDKLEGRLQEVQVKLQGLEAKLEGQQAVLTRMADSQAKLEGNLIEVLTRLQNQPQATVNRMENQNQLQGASTTTEANVNIPSGFEKIGSRNFKIVNERVDWITAERRCREIGGYLASFRNEEEINAINEKLQPGWGYWLGVNDRGSEGRFVSVASQKPAEFLKWFKGQPDNEKNIENCVTLYNGEMWDFRCDYNLYFICQADNET